MVHIVEWVPPAIARYTSLAVEKERRGASSRGCNYLARKSGYTGCGRRGWKVFECGLQNPVTRAAHVQNGNSLQDYFDCSVLRGPNKQSFTFGLVAAR
jgi:hypothetical protein